MLLSRLLWLWGGDSNVRNGYRSRIVE